VDQSTRSWVDREGILTRAADRECPWHEKIKRLLVVSCLLSVVRFLLTRVGLCSSLGVLIFPHLDFFPWRSAPCRSGPIFLEASCERGLPSFPIITILRITRLYGFYRAPARREGFSVEGSTRNDLLPSNRSAPFEGFLVGCAGGELACPSGALPEPAFLGDGADALLGTVSRDSKSTAHVS
jgi:hypothetical protein